ncbi:CD225/dispanin family protein [Stenotrophomonas maltophilia]|uniref:CD225/dispanin family protein n=1 Tax=Stenotrophomonas maltophilia TaxID=40324 RepID=UPI001110D433|nr:CD225/dispanin family protein [Stenotrophomonas maltophilia]TIL14195.1 CD225/dispanin family protein [Stenotrophomonas maltophilia]
MNTATPQVPNNLVWAILTTLFCCLPAGIVSIVYAAQVNGKLAAGDIAGAQDSATKAKKWAIWSAIAWAVLVVLYVLFFVVLGGMGAMSNSGY